MPLFPPLFSLSSRLFGVFQLSNPFAPNIHAHDVIKLPRGRAERINRRTVPKQIRSKNNPPPLFLPLSSPSSFPPLCPALSYRGRPLPLHSCSCELPFEFAFSYSFWFPPSAMNASASSTSSLLLFPPSVVNSAPKVHARFSLASSAFTFAFHGISASIFVSIPIFVIVTLGIM